MTSIHSVFAPDVSGGCTSFDIVCECVCVSACLAVTAERTDVQTWYVSPPTIITKP